MKTLRGGGFFDSLTSSASSVGNAISGSIATGLLNVLLRADSSVLNAYRGSAVAMARRNPQKVAQAEVFLDRFTATIREGLEEGKRQATVAPPAVPKGGKRTQRVKRRRS